MATPFGPEDAKRLRDMALARVSAHAGEDWGRSARTLVRCLPAGWEGTGEDIRVLLSNCGFRSPHHHNAWGAMIMVCVKHNWLLATGETRHMKTERSHARDTKVYRRTRKP
jgi:hypothetical protein